MSLNCGGPDNTKWDGERCVTSGAQTSCDELAQDTCYYAALIDGVGEGNEIYYLGGRFLDDGRLEVGALLDAARVAMDLTQHWLGRTGLQVGDKIDLLNGRKVKPRAFLAFTPKYPFRSARVCRGSDGSVELILRKTRR